MVNVVTMSCGQDDALDDGLLLGLIGRICQWLLQ